MRVLGGGAGKEWVPGHANFTARNFVPYSTCFTCASPGDNEPSVLKISNITGIGSKMLYDANT